VKVLVTGGAGFIGSHVVDAFLGAGHTVSVVDNLATGNPAWLAGKPVTLYAMDLRSARLADVFHKERPEAVAHLAAQASVGRSVADPGFDASVNLAGGLNLLDCCRRVGVQRIIYSASSAGYGDTEVIPTPEDHPSRPSSPYGVSKAAMEQYIVALGALHGWTAVSLRYANVYGPRQNPSGEAGVVAIFCTRLLDGVPCQINGDGKQTRDYIYVADVAAANLAALERPRLTGSLNIGTGSETTVLDLHKRLCNAVGLDAAFVHAPARPGEQRRSCLDAARAARELGWRPTVSLDEGLALTYGFFKKERSR
jgi:UDP-glucose 4-epimerase